MSPSIMHGTRPRLIAMFARYIVSVDLPVSVLPTSITVIFLPVSKADNNTCRGTLCHADVPASFGSAHHNLPPCPSRACSLHLLLSSNGSALPPLTFIVWPDTSHPRIWHTPFTTTLAGPFTMRTLSAYVISSPPVVHITTRTLLQMIFL